MSWGFSAPQRCDFDTEEDWQNAMDAYEYTEDLYMEEYIERSRGIDF